MAQQSSVKTTYIPTTSKRTTIIQRSSGTRSSLPGYGVSSRSSVGGLNFAAGTYQNLSSSGVANVRDNRQKEKKEMQGLNERLAGYIEQVRFCECRIKYLEEQLAALQGRDVFDIEPIRAQYEGELNQARSVIDDMAKDKAGVDAKMAGLQDEIQRLTGLVDIHEKHKADYISKINQLTTQAGEYEGELGSLRLRIRNVEDENDKLRELLQRANDDLKKYRTDLDCETAAHIEASNRAQTFEEECEFLRSLLDKMPKEPQPITQIGGMDQRLWWEGQLAKCVKDMKSEYDCVVQNMRDDMQMRMDAQVRQLQSGALRENLESGHLKEEVKKLKTQIGDKNSALQAAENRIRQLEGETSRLAMELAEVRREHDELKMKYTSDMDRLNAELECCLQEIQLIMDAKLSLELEICCYRQLLEGEENRAGLKQIVEQAVGVQSSGAQKLSEFITSGSSSLSTSEAAGKMVQSRSSRGNIAFVQVSVDGSFVEIENNSKNKSQNLSGWTVKKSSPGRTDVHYSFDNYTLKPGDKYRIYAEGNPPPAGANVGCPWVVNKGTYTWHAGTGTCVLMDDNGAEKASLKSTVSNVK